MASSAEVVLARGDQNDELSWLAAWDLYHADCIDDECAGVFALIHLQAATQLRTCISNKLMIRRGGRRVDRPSQAIRSDKSFAGGFIGCREAADAACPPAFRGCEGTRQKREPARPAFVHTADTVVPLTGTRAPSMAAPRARLIKFNKETA